MSKTREKIRNAGLEKKKKIDIKYTIEDYFFTDEQLLENRKTHKRWSYRRHHQDNNPQKAKPKEPIPKLFQIPARKEGLKSNVKVFVPNNFDMIAILGASKENYQIIGRVLRFLD